MLCYCSPLLDLVGCFGKPVLVEKETTLISVSISFLCAEGLSQVRESADFVINIGVDQKQPMIFLCVLPRVCKLE